MPRDTQGPSKSGNTPDLLQQFAEVGKVGGLAPFSWVRKGTRDLLSCQFSSMFYGVAFALIGWTIAFSHGGAYWLTLSALVALMLVGPLLAIGLYALSRQRERGQEPRLRPTLSSWRGNMSNLGLFALAIGVVTLVWARASMVIFAVLYDTGLPTADSLISELLSFENIPFVLTYLIVGALFASFVFAVSVVAVPLMFDQGKDAISAMLLSLSVVARNPLAMIVWAVLLVLLIGIGFAVGFPALVFTAPIAGHATWHAYRDLIPARENMVLRARP